MTMQNETLRAITTLLRASETTQDRSFRDACALFDSIDDDAVFASVVARWPHLMNYDGRGNWVGSCGNENGGVA
jgi:hypothetical protein